MSYPDLRGKVAVLTGGAQGIGEFTVRELARQGARVTFCDVDVARGKKLEAGLNGKGAHAPTRANSRASREFIRRATDEASVAAPEARAVPVSFVRADLAREADIKKMIRGVIRNHGRIDLLINNAAVDTRIPLEKTSARHWQTMTDINLRHAFLTIREAAPQMKKQHAGVIVNFSSMAFFAGVSGYIAYLASKAGIIGLTRGLARELGPHNIRVNAVAPGWVMTERQLRLWVKPGDKENCLERQCLKELLQPDEIARVVAFLCSDASRAITGQVILADKGWHHD